MSYQEYEQSTQRADPVYLFRISVASEVLRYTSAANDVVAMGETWLHAPFETSGINLSNNSNVEAFTITLPYSHELAQKLMGYISVPTGISVFSGYLSDADQEFLVEWSGVDCRVNPEDAGMCRLVFTSIFNKAQAQGLSPVFQRRCRHAVYSEGCGLDSDAFAIDVDVLDVDGKIITIEESSSTIGQNFSYGMIKSPDGVYHFVYSYSAGRVELFDAVPAIIAAFDQGPLTLQIYPGCDQSIARCRELGNWANFGGDQWLSDNPFDGRSLF